MLVSAATVSIAALMGWGTYAAGRQRVSTDEARLVKRRLFVSAASLELILVLSALTVLIAGVQVAYGDPSHAGGTVVWLLFLNLPRLLAFAGCVYCVLTYPAFRKFVVGFGCVFLAIGIFVSLLLMLFLGTWMLVLIILLTFYIWFISFMYLRKLKVAAPLPPKTPPAPTPHSTGGRHASRTVYELSLWGNIGKQGWIPAQSPVSVDQKVLAKICSDGRTAPTPAYALETPASGDGKTWTLRPVPGVGLLINSSLTTAPTVLKPGDKIALLPRGKSDPSDAFAKVIVKTRTMVESSS